MVLKVYFRILSCLDIFVNAVYLYDDKLVIAFNYKEATKTVSLKAVNGSIIEYSGAPINPIVNDTFTMGFIISFVSELEPIAVELSGGQFLPPVQTLVATLIFAKGKNANRVRPQILIGTSLREIAEGANAPSTRHTPAFDVNWIIRKMSICNIYPKNIANAVFFCYTKAETFGTP